MRVFGAYRESKIFLNNFNLNIKNLVGEIIFLIKNILY
jgi:hypothetical protein